MRISTKFTYEDLEAIPPDRNRYEIVDGELIVTAAPIPLHQRIVLKLGSKLLDFAEKHHFGQVYVAPLDIVFTRSTVLEPDLLFISNDRLHIVGEKHLTGPPDLVVEVLSESTALRDRLEASTRRFRDGMARAGFAIQPGSHPICPIMLGDAKLAVDMAARLNYKNSLESALFPGLRLPVSSLWES